MIKTKNKLRIHVIGIPRNPSTPEITMDPYAMVSYHVTSELHKKGHEVHYYGLPQSSVKCTTKWECADINHHKKYNVSIEEAKTKKTHWGGGQGEGDMLFYSKAADLVFNNYKANDIILVMWSLQFAELHTRFAKSDIPIKIVDAHIGHHWPSATTPYHVYTSHANRHFCYGMHNEQFESNYWHDATIYPMASVIGDFEYKEKKKDYFLFMARLNKTKGLGVFLQLASHFPEKKFILAGQGNHDFYIPPNVKEVGLLNPIQRKEYLADAKAVISPSFYPEPFGLTAVEAGLSGTPLICTDHGGYTETIKDGHNGFRCSYFSDFIDAINNIENIKAKDCKEYAYSFSNEPLTNEWEKYLQRVNKKSWYDLD
tara:strand:+ start:75 stop:1184 length:1110 start_codon:yes stop_codon:yes gene_type:complete